MPPLWLRTRLPAMPTLSTPGAASPNASTSRAARKSGQRLLVSGVEALPSVIESPIVTMAPGARGARADVDARQEEPGQRGRVDRQLGCAGVIARRGQIGGRQRGAVTGRRGSRWPRCPPGDRDRWPARPAAAAPARPGRSAAPRRARIVADGAPPNVKARPVAAAIAAPLPRSATCAAPISSGSLPYWLLNSTRTLEPPMLVRTTCRSVWPATRGGVPG